MRDDFLVFGAPLIGQEEIREVVDSIESGWLGTGPKVARFEADFATYQGVSEKHVAAVNSCTAAPARQHGGVGHRSRRRGHYHSAHLRRDCQRHRPRRRPLRSSPTSTQTP